MTVDDQDFREIAYELDGHVATITLDRPEKMNAGTTRMIAELLRAIDVVDGDDNVRALVITGRGRAFCAGADLSAGSESFEEHLREADEAIGAAPDPGTVPRDGAGLVTTRLFRCTKPVIAAVNGAAVGMGATMILAADVRVASENARFGFVFARRGIVPEGASTWFLPRLVGIAQAAEWMYSARVFGADEALGGRLVRSVHPADDLLPAAMDLAREFAESAPLSVALTRQMLWRMLTASGPMDAHRVDSRALQVTGGLADAKEGVRSFLEKRPAAFSGSVSEQLPDVFPGPALPPYSES